MTVWRKGMLAAVVDDTACPYFGNSVPMRAVYRVVDVTTIKDVWGRDRIALKMDRDNPIHPVTGAEGYHNAIRFRPVVEAKQDTALIERIKRCKPARKSVEA